jgi:hypothetical protein
VEGKQPAGRARRLEIEPGAALAHDLAGRPLLDLRDLRGLQPRLGIERRIALDGDRLGGRRQAREKKGGGQESSTDGANVDHAGRGPPRVRRL